MSSDVRFEEGYDRFMKVRIGISTTDKLLELEIEDVSTFKKEIESVIADGGLGWFKDAKGKSIGIPARSVAFIEIDDAGGQRAVGFSPGS